MEMEKKKEKSANGNCKDLYRVGSYPPLEKMLRDHFF
jgi:hypothetical protein